LVMICIGLSKPAASKAKEAIVHLADLFFVYIHFLIDLIKSHPSINLLWSAGHSSPSQ
jgi:hypothetical protein